MNAHASPGSHISVQRPNRRIARSLYWQGWTIVQIAEELEENSNTIRSWKRRDIWDKAAPGAIMGDAIEQRFSALVLKDTKSGGDIKEIDLLGREAERMARIDMYKRTGREADLNPKIKARNDGKAIAKREKKKNLITAEHLGKLKADVEKTLYTHQFDWRASTSLRTRFILKSRQIGATWYFARERLIRALETGNNQIFISASKAQAHIFRNYITAWVQQVCGLKLQGDPIVIQRGWADEEGEADCEEGRSDPLEPVNLYFLGTNYRTAQGYSGDVIIDECFWIYGFEELYKVAAAMATHMRFTRTLFSTPSVLNHQAYAMWSGERFNKKRPKADQVAIDIAPDVLKDGRLGADGIWRQIVPLEMAVERGFDLIDVQEIKLENSIEEYDNLYRCIFLDDSQSSFPFELVRRAMVDSWEAWSQDFAPYALRPFGDGEIWLGYDPNASANGDDAALVAVAPPDKPGGKFRILEKARLKGPGFEAQAAKIKEWCDRYNAAHIAIDTNGVGEAVFQLVQKFFPTAVKVDYSPRGKALMVHKAQNIMRAGRLEFDAGWQDMLQCFMAIHPDITKGGQHVTYRARRAEGQGHADLAWAVMHVLINEPLDAETIGGKSGKMEMM